MPMYESVRFDRAADTYDASRALPPDVARATNELLLSRLRGQGRVLEVGVGTGLLALPLHESGVRLAGVDLSGPMLAKLVEKAGGRPPFPLVRGDATGLPFRGDVFGAALLRWVLHLVPMWEAVLDEVMRVVRPSGILIVQLGGYDPATAAIRNRFAEVTGYSIEPVGLGWRRTDLLDFALEARGARLREAPIIKHPDDEPLGEFLSGIERNLYSWTWPVPEDARLGAVPIVRAWAEERFGPLDRPFPQENEMVWRLYDLPG